MRSTQIIGLTKEAKQYIDENVRLVEKECPLCKCGKIQSPEQKQYADARNLGMFNDGPMLNEYIMKDGTILREIVQETVWSSGPCIFLCLCDINGKRMFEWSDDDLKHA